MTAPLVCRREALKLMCAACFKPDKRPFKLQLTKVQLDRAMQMHTGRRLDGAPVCTEESGEDLMEKSRAHTAAAQAQRAKDDLANRAQKALKASISLALTAAFERCCAGREQRPEVNPGAFSHGSALPPNGRCIHRPLSLRATCRHPGLWLWARNRSLLRRCSSKMQPAGSRRTYRLHPLNSYCEICPARRSNVVAEA